MVIIALVLPGLTLVYFVVTTSVDLFPFNNVRDASRTERRSEVATNGPVMAVPIILVALAAALPLPLLAYVGGTLELLVAAGGISLWWLPYLAGVTVPWATMGTEQSWSALHARTYARTVIVLPARGDRPRPNLEHMVLHSLLIASGVMAVVAGTSI